MGMPLKDVKTRYYIGHQANEVCPVSSSAVSARNGDMLFHSYLYNGDGLGSAPADKGSLLIVLDCLSLTGAQWWQLGPL